MSHTRIVGRTLARSQALQVLFQAEATGRSVDDVLSGAYVLTGLAPDLPGVEADEEAGLAVLAGPIDPFGELLARGAGSMTCDLDRILSLFSQNWDVRRMPAVDRNLLRLAVYELMEVDEVAPAVTISESVELAKAYGTDESSRFINGILGAVAARLEAGEDLLAIARAPRPAEGATPDAMAAAVLEEDAAQAGEAEPAATPAEPAPCAGEPAPEPAVVPEPAPEA